MHRLQRSRLPLLVAALAVLVALPSLAGEVDAATKRWVARCDDVRVRTEPRLSSKVLDSIDEGTRVVAVKTVRAGKWTARCGGALESRRWLKIVSIDGTSTKALFGRSAVFAAKRLFKYVRTLEKDSDPSPDPSPDPTPDITTTNHVSNCPVRLRETASIDAATTAIIDENMIVTSSGTVSGGAWEAECGDVVSGNTWLKVTAVGGESTTSLYGLSVLYAASGLFTQITTTSSYREGVDVSHWQGTINWGQVAAAGKSFAIAKATEGVGYKDDTYARNKAQAMANGLKFGAYHFARPENNAVREADWFVDNADYEHGMLIPTLDLERTGGRGPTGLTNWTKAWLQRVEERLGVKAMIYMSPHFWRTNLNDTRWFADNGYDVLWIAHWHVSTPLPPADNWGGKGWTFWQYTSDGRVPGIQGGVDLNRYRFGSFARVTY
jgi:GH25 family lysozyme M1 (1,4-beta-N-acetylmuramidase)